MSPEDQYPSTEYCALTLKKGDDAVLLCMINARERYNRGATRANYADHEGGACAIGALWMAGLVDDDGYGEKEAVIEIADKPTAGAALASQIELLLSEEAKEAIELVNRAALELHPEASDYEGWSGPLEWVNQSGTPTGQTPDEWLYDDPHREDEDLMELVKDQVLEIYDKAIEDRRADVLA